MGHFGFVCQVTKHLVDKLVQEHDQPHETKLQGVMDTLVQNKDHQGLGDVVDRYIRKKDPFKGPKLLEALSVLCECNGVPIIRNQGILS